MCVDFDSEIFSETFNPSLFFLDPLYNYIESEGGYISFEFLNLPHYP